MVEALLADPEAQLATVAVRGTPATASGRTTLLEDRGRALDFSRKTLTRSDGTVLIHVGLYAYRCSSLPEVVQLPPGPRELDEGLEQLRWMECGLPVAVVVAEGSPEWAHAVDRASDLSGPPQVSEN